MLSPNDRKLEKLDPFYRSPVSKQKTSAEIISEARNALRTVRTQRPFTPREEQRKLFGPASSRTPESRPPSSFRAAPAAHGGSQARGRIRAVATSLHYSYSNSKSEPHL